MFDTSRAPIAPTHICKRCNISFELEAPAYKRTWCRPCRLAYSKSHNARKIRSRCLQCNVIFVGRNTRQKYCSDVCRHRCPVCQPLRITGIPRTCETCKTIKRRCLGCGDVFNSQSKIHMYCGTVCREATQRVLIPFSLLCVWCFGPFSYDTRKKCCSDKCSRAFSLHLKQYRTPNLCYLPICRDCHTSHGASIEAFAVRKYRCYNCAKVLADDATTVRNRQKEARRRSKAYRRGEIVNNGDKIDPKTVADRDKWACHLCSLPIDGRFKWPHPGSLTIDHIIPITPFKEGDTPGTHTWDNVAAAHASCNSRRGNKPLTQAG